MKSSIAYIKVALVSGLLVLIILTSACTPSASDEPTEPEPVYPAQSLVYLTPFTDPGSEPAVPERMSIGESSVIGYRNPEDAVIRFKVELRDNAQLSLMLGAQPQIPIHMNDLVIRIEYIPETWPEDAVEQTESGDAVSPGTVTLYETSPENNRDMFYSWVPVNVTLDRWGPGTGELRLVAEGPVATNEELNLYWGAPTIYYPGERKYKNILLIGVDTLRADAISPYGAPEEVTPVLQELCESGTTFMQAHSQAPWTLPSFASMITGNLPSVIGSTIYTGHLPDRNTTIAEILHNRGYSTGMVCSNTWLGNDQSGFEQGMDYTWFKYPSNATDAVQIAEDFMVRANGRDFFLFLHFMDPHTPYSPPEYYQNLYCDPEYSGLYKYGVGSIEEWKSGVEIPSDEDLQQAKNLYRGEVAFLDHSIGELFEFMEANNLLDNTLIVFAADHGEEFFEHGQFEHGHTQFEELVHMPLIIKGDGFPAGQTVNDPVGNIDIVPSILNYLDIDPPEVLPGIPLQNFTSGEENGSRIIFGEDNTRGHLRKFAIAWPYKCILDYVSTQARLYNLEDDPGEHTDISSQNPEITNELKVEIVRAMLPEQTAFHCWITRSYGEESHLFTGSLRIPGGIRSVMAFMLTDDDSYEVVGDTVTFSIRSSQEVLGPNKHLLLIPETDADLIEVALRVDGDTPIDRFFPYGNKLTSEPSGFASVALDSFPLGHNLPYAIEEFPARCYIWGVRGYDRDPQNVELDEQALEQLRALGYAGGN